MTIAFTPSHISVAGVEPVLLRGQLYTLTVNTLAYASRGGDFKTFLSQQLAKASKAYIPVKQVDVKEVSIKQGLSKCTVEYRTPYGAEKITVYLQVKILDKKTRFDSTTGLYVVELNVEASCDQYYPKKIHFYSSTGKTSYKWTGQYYKVAVYLQEKKKFTLYAVDWRNIRVYIEVNL